METAMLGWDRHSTPDGMARRLASLREEIDDLQSALGRKAGGLERMASDAHDWISDHAGALPRLDLSVFRGHRHAAPRVPTLAVALAAMAVGVGVGCVLYAVTSGGHRRATTAQDGVRRPASRVSE